MLTYYFVLHSTVTNYKYVRLYNITTKLKKMRTLNNNQISQKLSTTKTYNWNTKRRFR
jgi:hypothetical protein